MGLKMYDELDSVEISKKMLELTSLSFSSMNSAIPLKRKFKSPPSSHFSRHLASPAAAAAATDMSDKKRIKLEDGDEDEEHSHLLDHHHHDIRSKTIAVASDINLPSPPSSTGSSFDAITRDSFMSENGDMSQHDDSLSETLHLNESQEDSVCPPMAMELESFHEDSDQPQQKNEDDDPDRVISQLVDELIVEVVEAIDGESWDDIKIDPNGVTILPSGLHIVKGVAEMQFYRDENDGPPLRYTNQLNFLKMVLNKYLNRYKSALPFLNPVDSVRLKIPHYYLVIKRPMDLNTVKNRLNFLWYQSSSECISDIRQIFKNCYQFNSPTDYVYNAGKKLEEYFEEKIKPLPPVEEEIPCPSRPDINEFLKQNEKLSSKRFCMLASNPDPAKQMAPDESGSEIDGSKNSFAPIKMITRSERGVAMKKPNKDLPVPITAVQAKPATIKRVPLNKPLRECWNFVKELFTKKHAEYAWPFWKPVDIKDYPDYLEKIKKPIDLTTIKNNIEAGKYLTVNQFATDMRLMFFNCLRYNAPDSPIIEQVRKLREVFEYRYAQFPEHYFGEKLVIQKDSSTPRPSTGAGASPGASVLPSQTHTESVAQKQQKKAKTHDTKGGKSVNAKIRTPTEVLPPSDKFNGNKPNEKQMKELRMQMERLTTALTSALLSNHGDHSATTAIIDALQSSVSNGVLNGASKETPGKNGFKDKNKMPGKRGRKRKRRLSEEAIAEDEEQPDDDDFDSDGNSSIRNGLSEPFDPKSMDDLKKLKNDLENLHATDLQNVLRILQSTEPSLRCDEEQNVEIDFQALKPKTLIALRKYVTSCMLNTSKESPSAAGNVSTVTSSLSSKKKKICHQTSTITNSSAVRRSGGLTFDTDCDNFINHNDGPPRAETRASTHLQLSEESSSSSDSENDD